MLLVVGRFALLGGCRVGMVHEEILEVTVLRVRVEKALFLPGDPAS